VRWEGGMEVKREGERRGLVGREENKRKNRRIFIFDFFIFIKG